jgi:hypothetical protein
MTSWLPALLIVIVTTGCSYELSFQDCEVSCQTSPSCPEGFTCLQGLCRSPGSTGSCGTVTLRQTADDKVERSLVFGCTNSDGTTPDTSWYRVFSLAESGITNTFQVEQVTVGICFSVGSPMLDVKLGLYGGSIEDSVLDLAKVTPLDAGAVAVPANQIPRLIGVPIDATVPSGSNIIVEVSTPDLEGTGQEVNIGLTAAAETQPAFLRAPLCGTAMPTTTTAAGHADAHFVITVTGTR